MKVLVRIVSYNYLEDIINNKGKNDEKNFDFASRSCDDTYRSRRM